MSLVKDENIGTASNENKQKIVNILSFFFRSGIMALISFTWRIKEDNQWKIIS